MKNLKESFGYNLHNLRKCKKITVEKFAEMVDLSPRQITRIESGDSFPSAETLCKISIALKVKLKTLFDISWYDDQMYYFNGKVIKPDIKIINDGNNSTVKGFIRLNAKKIEINEKMPQEKIPSFLINLSITHKSELIIEIFEKKKRDQIVKISPNGHVETVIKKEDLKENDNYDENRNYSYISEKLKEFASDEAKLEYIKTSIDAISNKESLENLKSIIKGIELTLLK